MLERFRVTFKGADVAPTGPFVKPMQSDHGCIVHPPDMVGGHVARSERSERRRHPVVIRRVPYTKSPNGPKARTSIGPAQS